MNSNKGVFVLGLFALILLSANFQNGRAATWTESGSLKEFRDGFKATLLPSGKVLIAGGYNGSTTTGAEIFDPSGGGSWTQVAPMYVARYLNSSTLLGNGQVLIVGGQTSGSAYTSDVELYNPASNSWAYAPALNNSLARQTATVLPNGKVFIAGGLPDNTGNGTPATWIYDPTAGTWTNGAPMVAARWFHTATLLKSGNVLVAGGAVFTNGAAVYLNSAELYDPIHDSWSSAGTMNSVHYEHAAALLANSQVLVAGGANASGALTNAEIYDPILNTWTNTGPMNIARSFYSAAVLPNGKVLVMGGVGPSSSILTNTEIYDPGSGTWTLANPLLIPRYASACVVLTNGNVLIAGGVNTTNYLTSTEIYSSTNLNLTRFPLSTPGKMPGGSLQLSFTNQADVSFNVYATTNPASSLSAWTLLGGPAETTPGHYQFIDSQATNNTRRFYNVQAP